jgi:hypothetical protein
VLPVLLDGLGAAPGAWQPVPPSSIDEPEVVRGVRKVALDKVEERFAHLDHPRGKRGRAMPRLSGGDVPGPVKEPGVGCMY